MRFQIVTLIENYSQNLDLFCEHGLSLFITDGKHRILFDAGASSAFLNNAKKLGISLEKLDALVLSHGHFDHTGGVEALLEQYGAPRTLYIGKHFFDLRYSDSHTPRLDISAKIQEEALERYKVNRQVTSEKIQSLYPGIFVVSGFTNIEELEPPAPFLLRFRKGREEVDLFEDEIGVVLETEQELTLISGCSHTGILSMCEYVSNLFGRPVTTFLGGTHLMEANEARVMKTCRMLKDKGVRRLGACHCNGEAAGAYFQENFPGFFLNHTGDVVEIK